VIGSGNDSVFGARDRIPDFEGAGVAGGDLLQLLDQNGRNLVFEGTRASLALGATWA
jgi:hypothetical protein